MNMNTSFAGLNIVSHLLAVTFKHEVHRHPIKKRRRNWRIVKVQRPACWQIGNTLYMHPQLIEKLKEDPQ